MGPYKYSASLRSQIGKSASQHVCSCSSMTLLEKLEEQGDVFQPIQFSSLCSATTRDDGVTWLSDFTYIRSCVHFCIQYGMSW